MKKLYLLPNVLHEESAWSYTPPYIDALIAESDKGAINISNDLVFQKSPSISSMNTLKNPLSC
jgi:hypothetical protein